MAVHWEISEDCCWERKASSWWTNLLKISPSERNQRHAWATAEMLLLYDQLPIPQHQMTAAGEVQEFDWNARVCRHRLFATCFKLIVNGIRGIHEVQLRCYYYCTTSCRYHSIKWLLLNARMWLKCKSLRVCRHRLFATCFKLILRLSAQTCRFYTPVLHLSMSSVVSRTPGRRKSDRNDQQWTTSGIFYYSSSMEQWYQVSVKYTQNLIHIKIRSHVQRRQMKSFIPSHRSIWIFYSATSAPLVGFFVLDDYHRRCCRNMRFQSIMILKPSAFLVFSTPFLFFSILTPPRCCCCC